MSKSKKEAPATAAAKTVNEPEQERIGLDPEDGQRDRSHDKTRAVLDELKQKSSEIVVRGLFAAPLDGVSNLVETVRDRLDESVGIDGWGQEYKILTAEPALSVICALHVRIAGEWVYKQGVGTPIEGSQMASGRIHQACENAFRNAAREFGIGRNSPGRTPVAAAATPSSNGHKEVKRDVKAEPPPKETPKGPTKAELAKVEELKKFWSIKLTECGYPDDLNTMLRGTEAKAIPGFAKRAVFEHIKSEAASVGWAYDKDTASFFADSQGTGVAIPF